MKLQRSLESLGRAIVRRPLPVLALAALAFAFGVFGAFRLRVETDIAKMLPADHPAGSAFTRITEAFSTTSSLVVAVEGENRESIVAAAESFAARLATDPRTKALVKSVRSSMDRDFLDSWAFMLLDEKEIRETDRILGSTRLLPLLRATNDLMEEKLGDGDDEEVEGAEGEDEAAELFARFAAFARRLRSALEAAEGSSFDAKAWAELLTDDFLYGERHFFDPEGRTLLMTVSPTFDLGDRSKLTALTRGAREIAASIEGGHFSFSGDVASEADEEEALGADLFYPSLIALLLIFLLFAFSFSSLRSIAFAVIALVVGIVADLGFAAFAVGSLNMITSSFGALLVGMGIDFGIHIALRYDAAIGDGDSPEGAMGCIFGGIVLPVSVGALTTAIAFYSLLFSRTSAFRQFGLIAGTGILTTLLSALTLLPALLALFPGRRPLRSRPLRSRPLRFRPLRFRPSLDYRFLARASEAVSRHRLPILALAAALTAGAALLLPRNSFDYDMRRIGPQGTEAQAVERMIGEHFGISTFQALASAEDLESVRALGERLRKAPFVRRVESLADYIPSPGEQGLRLAALAEAAARPGRAGSFAWDEAAVAAFSAEIGRLEMNLVELGDLSAAANGENSLPTRARNATIREVFGAERGRSGEELYAKLLEALGRPGLASPLARIDEAFASALVRRAEGLFSPGRPMVEADLPAELLSNFRSADGRLYLAAAQPSRALLADEEVRRFSAGLSAADPGATGSLVLGVELSEEVLAEARSSAILVALVVFAVVALGFRSLAALAAVALSFAMALVCSFGFYSLVGSFNIVNALAIPLIIGVGIDYAVHLASAIMEGRQRPDRERALELERTSKAVALSALTTLFGFGSLAFAGRFKGIADLGATLSIGVFCCLVSALFVLPALYRIKARSLSRNPETQKELAE